MKLINNILSKLHLFFVGCKFKKDRQKIINNIRKMILRFINNIQSHILTTYHIIIDFQTKERKPTHYRLELLAELRNDLECDNLISQLQSQLLEKFNGVNFYKTEITTIIDKQRIEEDFNNKLKNHVSMKFIFRQWVTTFQQTNPIGYKTIRVIDETIESNGVKNYKVNILKSGEISFSAMQDMFVVELETDEFKIKK